MLDSEMCLFIQKITAYITFIYRVHEYCENASNNFIALSLTPNGGFFFLKKKIYTKLSEKQWDALFCIL